MALELVVPNMSNAAFDEGNAANETARILRDVADKIESRGEAFLSMMLHDANGNWVGEVTFDPHNDDPLGD
jgi:acyl-CoA reductase-like NAD-dependent aldehyde dehydrogenase